ncbi:DUF5682 family protein [Streptomyces sp. NPDC097640]|uniref:DUF5682 family protein n=1 Tax=Streptomyces sp. NPDC097640 TaxID=3157229 RepID=UPI0033263ADF
MSVTFVPVRHHSPACARLVRSVIASLQPAFVLVEGPADVNDRLDELLLGHQLPVAIFSSYRDGERYEASWTPFCAYSPEWVALTAGRTCGAEVRFIDLPAWHPALAGFGNRYADAELRHAEAVARLCNTFAVDNVDVLWDHLFEAETENGTEDGTEDGNGLEERLTAYFDLVRGESRAAEDDEAREAYMARWIRAAVAEAGDRPVVVVSGGFHQPALRTLSAKAAESTADGPEGPEWPEVPRPPQDALADSFLVPYSFPRLDAFTGYQSGMPSPEYYQRLWDEGPQAAATGLVKDAVARLRQRGHVVSTADLIAARTMTDGLARLRGHRSPSRTDLLDGLASALISDGLGQRLPWSSRGALAPGAHPVVAELMAAFSGDRAGRLHPDTPAPPLVHDVRAELERLGLDRAGAFALSLDLSDDRGRGRSRALHRLRVLGIPGFQRRSGPAGGADLVLNERWGVAPSELRLPRLIEAGAYGATLRDAATAVLRERIADAGNEMVPLARVLFDAALCGLAELSDGAIETIEAAVAGARDLGALGETLSTVLGLWRHDRLLGSAGSPVFGAVVSASVARILWLAEGVHGGPAPADRARLHALAATRDALVHAGPALGLDRSAALGTARRISADATAPPDLRGAAFGLCWSLDDAEGGDIPGGSVAHSAGPDVLGDWLAGLFALARAEVLAAKGSEGSEGSTGMFGVLDTVVAAMSEDDFLVALPALRQAFAYFPPRERETIARGLLDRRGLRGSARSLTRTAADPLLTAEGMALEARVTRLLAGEGLAPAETTVSAIDAKADS